MFSTDPSYDNRTIASTLKMQIRTVQRIGRPFGGGGAKAQGWGHRQEDLDQGVPQKDPGNHWWNSPAAYSADCQRFRRLTQNCVNACVKENLKCKSYRRQTSQILTEKTKNFRLIKSVTLLTWTRSTTSFGHTLRTSPTWPPTTPKPAWARPSTEYSPSSCRHLWKRHAPSSGSVSRRWLRLKAAILNRCQLYYIIKLPELIFLIKVLK